MSCTSVLFFQKIYDWVICSTVLWQSRQLLPEPSNALLQVLLWVERLPFCIEIFSTSLCLLYSEMCLAVGEGRKALLPAAGLGKGQLAAQPSGFWTPWLPARQFDKGGKHLCPNCIPEGPIKLGGRREERPQWGHHTFASNEERLACWRPSFISFSCSRPIFSWMGRGTQ